MGGTTRYDDVYYPRTDKRMISKSINSILFWKDQTNVYGSTTQLIKI